MKIDLRKVFVENITYFWKNNTIFGKERLLETLECVHAYTHTHTHTHAMHTHAYGMCTHPWACVHMLGFQKLCKESFLHFILV